MTDENTFHLFNTKTMSGIHPGSRSARVHIVRLQAVGSIRSGLRWARILWPGEMEGCVVYLQGKNDQWEEQPFLRLPAETDDGLLPGLLDAFADAGQEPLVCGTCRWWQPVEAAATADGIPIGLCTWTATGQPPGDALDVRQQCGLAMECPQWQAGVQPSVRPKLSSGASVTPEQPPGWWSTLKSRLGRKKRPGHAVVGDIIERSGVGAGTERCLACHGRIANLGALTVAAEGDDKRTISIWRCRYCHTFYVNDWIDRWERLDNLETEESYYRIAPDEALTLLAFFQGTKGGEHPKERHSRTAQRTQIDAFLINRPRLLHQIKLGR